MFNRSGNQLALLVLRAGLGINMLMHGLVRFPNLRGFVNKTAAGFAQTVLPTLLTQVFLYTLPFLEFGAGLLILVGNRFLKPGLTFGGLIMAALLFGTTLKQDWATAGTQMIYVIAFAVALMATERR